MLSDRCLSVLSCPVCPVCDVRALWPNGWTDQDETWHAGRPRPWPHCVRWGRLYLPKKRTEAPPQFSAHFYCGQTAGCIEMPLGMHVGLSPGDFVLDGDPVTLPKKGAEPPNFRPMFIVSCPTRVKRLYACAHIHYLCFSNYRMRVKYSGESRDVTVVICAKNRLLQYVQSYRCRNIF